MRDHSRVSGRMRAWTANGELRITLLSYGVRISLRRQSQLCLSRNSPQRPRPLVAARACARLTVTLACGCRGERARSEKFFSDSGTILLVGSRIAEHHLVYKDRRTQWEKSCLAFRYHWMDLSLIKMMTHHWYSHGWEAHGNISMKSWAMRWARTAR